MWIKMIDLQKGLVHQNLSFMQQWKKLKVIVVQNILLKNNSKNTKEK